MISIEKTKIVGFEEAIRGMRNHPNNLEKSDSGLCKGGDNGIGCMNCASFRCDHEYDGSFQIGNDDFKLMTALAEAGNIHSKYRENIIVYADITAPLYWWQEFHTYVVDTTANSYNIMHKITDKEFTLNDFSHESLISNPGMGVLPSLSILKSTIDTLNAYRNLYINISNHRVYGVSSGYIDPVAKDAWWQMIQLLPNSYNQTKTVKLNYDILAYIYADDSMCSVTEWDRFCDWVKSLPYSSLITCSENV